MNLEELEVKINTPYPELEDVVEDYKTVAVLKNLAMSRIGELTAVLQYVYQASITNSFMDDVAELFEEIGVVEMMHLDMLMHAIVEFGGVPIYEDSQSNIFNGKYVNYAMKLKDMLENNIQAEKMAIEDYKRAITLVKNESLKKLFERIIEDEKRHIEIFKYLLNNVKFLSV